MKDKTVAYLLWAGALVGLAGLQRIYLGKYVTGFLYLFTWGLCGIGQLVDLFAIPDMVEVHNNRVYVAQMTGGARHYLPRTAEDLQVALVQAAGQRGGKLSVAEGVAATGRGFRDVEKELNKMAVEGYIEPDSDDGGNLYFRFPGLS